MPWRDSVDAQRCRDRRRSSSRWSVGLAAWTDRHFRWLLVAPAVLLILALSIYPLLFSVWVCFVNYDFQIPGHAFVGLQNFTAGRRRSRSRAGRWPATAILSVADVAIEFLLGLFAGARHGQSVSAAAA